MRRAASLSILLLFAAAGCRTAPHAAPADSTGAAPSAPADTLVLSTDSVQVWFTLARPDTGTDGRCVERTLEIRRGGKRTPVPLLYTGDIPTLVNDSTIRARLWNDCRPRDTYLVDLRTGQPTPARSN